MLSEWQSTIAQADLADLVTVAAYLLAAFTSAQAARSAGLKWQERDRMFWRLTTVLLVLLGVNELLDLQTLLTSMGRNYAKASGWYGEHRKVQYIFVMALAFVGVIAGIVTLWLTRQAHALVRLALIGLGFIGMFVLLRAASIHHLDDLLGSGAPRFNWGSVQEMIGIAIVAVSALTYTHKRGSMR